MQGSTATVWQPKSLRQWLWTAAGAGALFTTLMVGYYVADPGDYGSFWSRVAEAAQKFPLILLISALVTAILAGLANCNKAGLAATGFGLVAFLYLAMALWPAYSMWSMARKGNVAVSLVSHFAMSTHPTAFPSRVSRDVTYGKAVDGTELLLDVWPATRSVPGTLHPAFVRIHGGGWIGGVKSGLPAWNLWLNDLGYFVFDVEYRKPPRAGWKDEIGDVKCALGFVFASAGKYGVDPARISVTGYSAGGNLATLAAYSMGVAELPPSCAAPVVPIKSVVNFYGPSDLTAMYDMTPSPVAVHDALQKYIGGPPGQFPDRFRALSPVTYVSAKSPPTITILGLSDRIVPREQADALDRALAAASVARETYLLPGADHGYDANWGAMGTQFSREKIERFLQKYGGL